MEIYFDSIDKLTVFKEASFLLLIMIHVFINPKVTINVLFLI